MFSVATVLSLSFVFVGLGVVAIWVLRNTKVLLEEEKKWFCLSGWRVSCSPANRVPSLPGLSSLKQTQVGSTEPLFRRK